MQIPKSSISSPFDCHTQVDLPELALGQSFRYWDNRNYSVVYVIQIFPYEPDRDVPSDVIRVNPCENVFGKYKDERPTNGEITFIPNLFLLMFLIKAKQT